MKPIEAIHLVRTDEELSFSQIRDINEAFKGEEFKGSMEKVYLREQVEKSMRHIAEKIDSMDLNEAKAAAYVLREFSTAEERQSPKYVKLFDKVEDRIYDLQQKSNTAIPNQEQYEQQPKVDATSGAEIINRNYTDMKRYAANENPLDENNEFYKSTRDGLDMLDVRDENNQGVDVKEDIIEVSKLQAMTDFLTSKEKVTQESFRKKLKDKIDFNIFAILNTDRAIELAQRGDTKNIRKEYEDMVSKFVNGGKNNKTKVKSTSFLSVITDASHQIDKFTNKIKDKFGEIPAVSGIKTRLKNLDARLTSKFGKKYTVTKEVVKGISGLATDLGLVTLAGAAGPVGLGIYAVYTFKKNVAPFLDKVEKSGMGIKEYSKQHKKEAALAGLFTASTVLTGVIGAAIAAHNTATHAGANVADSWTRYASQGKILAGAGAVLVKQGADVKQAVDSGKGVGKAVGKMALSMLLFGVAAEAREYFGSDVNGAGHGNDTPDVINNITNNNTTNIYIDNCCEPVVYQNDQVVEPTPTPTPEPTPVVEKPLPAVERPVSHLPIPEIDMGKAPHLDVDSPFDFKNDLPIPEIDMGKAPYINVEPPEEIKEVLANGVNKYDNVLENMGQHAKDGTVLRDGKFWDQQASTSSDLDARAEQLKQDVYDTYNCDEKPNLPKDGVRKFNSVAEQKAADLALQNAQKGGRNS